MTTQNKTVKGLLGKKLGMTQVFDSQNKIVPVTVIEAGPCVVLQKKSVDTDGYDALQIGFGEAKEKNTPKALLNHFAKANATPKAVVKELRNCSIDKQVGESLTCEIFTEGEKVNVVGISKGKGFQGVVKRHGFSGVGEASHGQHDRQRAPGSIGGSSYPSRVFKGMRMAGRMGGDQVKVKALRVVKVFADKNYILVTGSVPGHNGSIVLIQN